MEKAMKELIETVGKYMGTCPWAQQQAFEEQIKELESEVSELKEALASRDFENAMEEYGDILLDVLMLGNIAEREKLFRMPDSAKHAEEKLKRRAPWVFGKEKVSSSEEAVKRWKEIKELEKQAKKK